MALATVRYLSVASRQLRHLARARVTSIEGQRATCERLRAHARTHASVNIDRFCGAHVRECAQASVRARTSSCVNEGRVEGGRIFSAQIFAVGRCVGLQFAQNLPLPGKTVAAEAWVNHT